MSIAQGARARVRAELTSEILEAARRRLAADGAAALSLRAVARDLGLVPSALYRYFPSRDALLTRLIVDAYDSVGAAAEAADPGAGPAAARLTAVAAAVRTWGLAHPHEWALIYGSPVPGYAAPEATIAAALRVPAALARPVAELAPCAEARRPPGPVAPAEVAAALDPVREALLPAWPAEVAGWAVLVYTYVLGATSLELFGHFVNGVLDPEAVFRHQIGALVTWVADPD